MSGESKAELTEQVAAEAAKRTAKKTAARKPRTPKAETVKVIVTTSSRGVKAGATRTLDKVTAARLIRQGHAKLPGDITLDDL